MMYLLLFIWITLCAVSAAKFEGYLATTSYGDVRGQMRVSRNGRHYYSFTSIPFAKPPIGELRFQDPEEPDPWNTTRGATREPPICIQRNYLFSSNPPIEGQEDCLYLNVFVPQVKVVNNFSDKEQLLPVMVFIHWGAFLAGRSTTGFLGPEYFMDKDVVLVTFNYRVGPFGFLSTLDDEAPGNYGFKDQVVALKWVQTNIGHFGGDKADVTIFGQSAGAGSVHYHLLSSSSAGLFHKAISQSGSALAGWAQPLNSIQGQLSRLQGQFVGCENFSNTIDLMRCLRSVPARAIMDTQDNFRVWLGNPLIAFGAVTETKSERNRNPFLTKTPLEYISSGEIKNVPWMTGVVKNEGVLKAASLIRPREVREELNKRFEKLVSETLLLFSASTTDPRSLYKNITNFYLGGKEYIDIEDEKTIQGFVDVYSDRAFLYPLYQSILWHSSKSSSPIYLYNFEYESTYTYGDLFANTEEKIDHNWGTCHCDDLLYLFNSTDLFQGQRHISDIDLSNILVNIWTNFAKYGNPNPIKHPVQARINWKPLNIHKHNPAAVNSQIELLNITGNYKTGPKLDISRGFYEKRMKFWTDSDIFENMYGLN